MSVFVSAWLRIFQKPDICVFYFVFNIWIYVHAVL